MKQAFLSIGDKVAVICPSSPISPEKIATCIQFLEEEGYEALASSSLYWNKGGFMAGNPKDRAEEIHQLFMDPLVKGIFCARGGDSSLEVLQYLNKELIRKNPKVFLGYSDITNLHVFLNQECELITFHGPMVQSDMIGTFDTYSRASLARALKGEPYLFNNPEGDPLLVIKEGEARGRLIGGNLSLVCAGLGGPNEVKTRGKILFLEDVNESVEHLHRMLWQLRYAGKFDDVAGVLLGDFKNCENRHDPSYDQDTLFHEFFRDSRVPVLMHLRSGHCMPLATLPLGARVHINKDQLRIYA